MTWGPRQDHSWILLPLLTVLIAWIGTACGVAYVAKSGWYQAELMLAREPIDEVVAQGRVTEAQARSLTLIRDVKKFGGSIGLAATENYETVALEWKREIWNVTACDPAAFEAKTWWFPIVGRVPYLGYFREVDARETEKALMEEGLDVYLRTAGAYSTLGWFRDPVLPGMLDWSEASLADTVLHEMTHSTLWVRGNVSFNESFASFVGEVAALRYLIERHGQHGAAVLHAVNRRHDHQVWRDVLQAMYKDLDAVYASPTLTTDEKLARKQALLAELPDRVRAAPLIEPERYVTAAREGVWNNARFIGFRTYNSNTPWFEAILKAEDGDLGGFIERIGELTKGAPDPFVAIQQAGQR
jgi:predicted aminopeptidase